VPEAWRPATFNVNHFCFFWHKNVKYGVLSF
jgi:hypothetical protein